MCVSILPARMSVHSISDRCPRGQEVPNPLELEWQTFVSVYVGDGNQTWVHWKSSNCS